MGGSTSTEIRYSQEYAPSQPGQSEIRRSPGVKQLVHELPGGVDTFQKVILNTLKSYGNNNFLGSRNAQLNNVYQYRTYKQVLQDAENLGSGLLNLNLLPQVNEYENYQVRLMGIFSKNRPEWIIQDIANFLYGFAMVPLYDTLGPENISYCIEHSGMRTIIAAAGPIDVILKTEKIKPLQNIVAMDEITEDQRKKAADRGLQIFSIQEVMEKGQSAQQPYAQVQPQDILTFSYTSGTTGPPKAAMLSHENFVSTIACLQLNPEIHLDHTDVHLSYLPLPHVFQRLMVTAVMAFGGSIAFYSGDVLKLKDDIAEVRPTIFASVPRLYNKFYDGIKGNMNKLTGMKKMMADTAVSTKLANLEKDASYTHAVWDRLVFKKTKELFGGRVKWMCTGSAPISAEVINFLKIAGCCPIFEGYGQTQSTGFSYVTSGQDPVSGHVGGPTQCIEVKLVDVPDMKYLSTDKGGARGEVCFRGPGVFLGYYKDGTKTAEAIDKDGWLHSGDIGVFLPNGALKIVDRKKNIFQLAQGEYVAPEKVENIYLRAKGVAEAFLHGDSLQSYCVAVIVPHQDYIMKYAEENQIQGSFEQLCQNPDIKKLMLKNITDQAKAEQVASFEQAQKLFLEPQSMLVHGCMTSTMKLQRFQAQEFFQPQIEEMYSTPLEEPTK